MKGTNPEAHAAMLPSLLSCLLCLIACSSTSDKADSPLEDTGSGGGGGGGGGGGAEEEEGTIPAMRLEGTVTWTLDFDAEAEANGNTDCTYTRTYSGVQYLDMDYLCPDCTLQARGTAVMTAGESCYAQISSAPETERTELWGLSDGAFFRSGRDQFPLGELAVLSDVAEGVDIALEWSSDGTLEVGTMLLQASGTVRYEADPETLLPDPWPARSTPYACGWPQNDPGTLVLDYDLQVGATFPNVRLTDQCGEELTLWDLYGSWLVLDTSQSDCGPCRTMAEGAEDFVADMAAEGLDVKVISLLGNGLSEPYNTPDDATFESWVSTYGLTDPVLYDQGFAYALFPEFVEEYTGESFGYPTWLVVDPTMNLIHGNVGFGDWDSVGDIIREADAR